jgi:hypothetical protein
MRIHGWALAVAVLALAGGAAAGTGDAERPAPAVDQLVLAETVAAPGATVRLPVRLIDQPGTPLGADQPFGAGIQAFALRVRALPEGAITSMTLRRSGVAAERTPLFESTPPAPGGAALLVSFEEGREPLLSFSGQRGTIIAEIEARLAAGLVPGTRIDLRLDPAVSVLGNQAGTIEESAANGTLRLRDGAIRIDGPWPPAGDSD